MIWHQEQLLQKIDMKDLSWFPDFLRILIIMIMISKATPEMLHNMLISMWKYKMSCAIKMMKL